jgi:hypothetical protein
MKKLELTESLLYVTDKSFNCGIGGKNYKFGVIFETLDTRDFDDKADEDYPFIVECGIIADKPHKNFDETEDSKPNKASLLYDCNSYMGAIPISHILQDAIKSGTENQDLSNFDNFVAQFTAFEVKVCETEVTSGTIAAQKGKTTHKYLAFKNEKTAEKYIDYIIKNRLSALTIMIGFILDAPINLIGETGWSMFNHMVTGKR